MACTVPVAPRRCPTSPPPRRAAGDPLGMLGTPHNMMMTVLVMIVLVASPKQSPELSSGPICADD
eukprot:12152577-Alexandrium_andersonii.AAC.1